MHSSNYQRSTTLDYTSLEKLGLSVQWTNYQNPIFWKLWLSLTRQTTTLTPMGLFANYTKPNRFVQFDSVSLSYFFIYLAYLGIVLKLFLNMHFLKLVFEQNSKKLQIWKTIFFLTIAHYSE